MKEIIISGRVKLLESPHESRSNQERSLRQEPPMAEPTEMGILSYDGCGEEFIIYQGGSRTKPSRNAKRIGSIKFWLMNTSANASTLIVSSYRNNVCGHFSQKTLMPACPNTTHILVQANRA
jgi:hypothetical protein